MSLHESDFMMTSMTMMGLTLVSLVRAILHCVLTITLVVYVAWVLVFLYQHESITHMIFLRFSCLFQ